MTVRPQFSAELIMQSTDGVTPPIRFGKQKFAGRERITLRQSTSWLTLNVDDAEAFVAALNEAKGFDAEGSPTPAHVVARKGW